MVDIGKLNQLNYRYIYHKPGVWQGACLVTGDINDIVIVWFVVYLPRWKI